MSEIDVFSGLQVSPDPKNPPAEEGEAGAANEIAVGKSSIWDNSQIEDLNENSSLDYTQTNESRASSSASLWSKRPSEQRSGTEIQEVVPAEFATAGLKPVGAGDIVAYLQQNLNKNGKFENLFEMIISPGNLLSAWLEIKSKQGSLTPGGDDLEETLDGLPVNWFFEVHEKLKAGTHSYKPSRRVGIPKKDGATRPLTIASPRDKIIQKAFLRVLEIIFEGSSVWKDVPEDEFKKFKGEDKTIPQKLSRVVWEEDEAALKIKRKKYFIRDCSIKPKFLHYSHAYRKGRSVHTLLEHMWKSWHPVSWLIPCDVEKAFDKVNHHILMSELQKHFDDQRVVNELWKMLKAEIIDFKIGKKVGEGTLGVPQGSIISPFLFNVYMNRLDWFMKDLIARETEPEKKRVINPAWRAITRVDGVKGITYKAKKKLIRRKKQEAKELGLRIYDYKTPEGSQRTKVYYVRYADDIMLGFEATKEVAKRISSEVEAFIKSNLQLNVKSTEVVHATSDRVPFLGFLVSRHSGDTDNHRGKEVEHIKRAKAMVLNRGAKEYEDYLKMVEWLGRQVIRDKIEQNRDSAKDILKPEDARALLTEHLDIKNSAMASIPELNRKRPNKLLNRAHSSRNQKVEYRIERWIKSSQALVGSKELQILSTFLGGEKAVQMVEYRTKLLEVLKDTMGKDAERQYILQLEDKATSGQAKARITDVRKSPSRLNFFAPIDNIKEKLKKAYIINGKGMPRSAPQKTSQTDYQIVSWYASVAQGILNFYSCATNHEEVRKLVNWSIRYSLLATLAHKHNKSTTWAINHFGKEKPAVIYNGKVIAYFPAAGEITSLRKRFNTQTEMTMAELNKRLNSERRVYSVPVSMFDKCGIKGCPKKPDEVHHIRKLDRIYRGKLVASISSSKGHGISNISKQTKSALSRKQVPLCWEHHSQVHSGQVGVGQFDKEFILKGVVFD